MGGWRAGEGGAQRKRGAEWGSEGTEASLQAVGNSDGLARNRGKTSGLSQLGVLLLLSPGLSPGTQRNQKPSWRGRQRHGQAGGVEAVEPGRPSLTVKAEEASWRREHLSCPRRPWRESSWQRA